MSVKDAETRLLRSLVEAGIITRAVAERVSAASDKSGAGVVERLVAEGALSEDDAYQILELELQIPFVRLETAYPDPDVIHLVPYEFAAQHLVLPLSRRDGELVLAMADPLNVMVMDEVRRITGMRVQPVLAKRDQIRRALEEYRAGDGSLETARAGIDVQVAQIEAEEAVEAASVATEDLRHDSPVARLVDSMIDRALQQRASDIHVEGGRTEGVVRFRVDGVLRDVLTVPMKIYPALTSRLKIMAGLDIAERRVPQDGRIAKDYEGRPIDFRVSVLPTVLGEKIVLRILDKAKAQVSLDDMGIPPEDRHRLELAIGQPHGMFVVTGPTGSGKTTTLYAILQRLNGAGVNILTCEDPVEYQLDRVNQTQLNTRAGLTFSAFLRAALRQDPDIIMVGEMRDSETAELGVRAALTGHLVLSTLHTNDAVGVVTRLVDMGIEPYLVASTVIGALSQRLCRRICSGCKTPVQVSAEELQSRYARLGLTRNMIVYQGRGCRACSNTGYLGRFAVFELMVPDAKLQRLISERADPASLTQAAREAGMTTLREAVIRRVEAGDTTLEEAARIVVS